MDKLLLQRTRLGTRYDIYSDGIVVTTKKGKVKTIELADISRVTYNATFSVGDFFALCMYKTDGYGAYARNRLYFYIKGGRDDFLFRVTPEEAQQFANDFLLEVQYI